MRSSVKGIGPLRRLMKQLPEAMSQEIIVELNLIGREALAAMRGEAPRRTGAVFSALRFKVYPNSLRLQVGLLGAADNKRLFYANIIDKGRRGGGRTIKKGTAKYGSGVGAKTGTHFVSKEKQEIRRKIDPDLGKIFDRALAKASAGGDIGD